MRMNKMNTKCKLQNAKLIQNENKNKMNKIKKLKN